ncbi:MAG: hypothetical protein Q9169_005904 [Polycauliona sp. 2 TL-2023]
MSLVEKLQQYDISPKTGFLPEEGPIDRLPDYYSPWETIGSNLPHLISTGKLKSVLNHLPLLSTQNLRSTPEYRRAYVILGFIASGLFFASQPALDHLPHTISIPFCKIALNLGIPPYATFAGQNLWNYHLIDVTGPVTDPSNLSAQFTFTGTVDESWFFIVLVAIEARGAPIIMHALGTFDAIASNDATTVIDHLNGIAKNLRNLSTILKKMYERCDPHIFYNRIRPFLSGCKASSDLPRGVFYDGEHGSETRQQFGGPSAAQSSLWHFVDLALGVEHLPTGTIKKEVDDDDDDERHVPPLDKECFFEKIREYMPGPHRRFLQRVATEANIRAYVRANPSNEAVQAAYNSCLSALIMIRNTHVQIVSRYIVVPSRSANYLAPTINAFGEDGDDLKVNDSEKKIKSKAVAGTSGTSPLSFLKQVRDETKSALFHQT